MIYTALYVFTKKSDYDKEDLKPTAGCIKVAWPKELYDLGCGNRFAFEIDDDQDLARIMKNIVGN